MSQIQEATLLAALQQVIVRDPVKEVVGETAPPNIGLLAQLVEQRTLNPLVEGSNPSGPTNSFDASH